MADMTTNFTPAGDNTTEIHPADSAHSVGLMTVAEVAREMRVTPRTVQRWITSGSLKAARIGGTVRLHRSDLLEAVTPKEVV